MEADLVFEQVDISPPPPFHFNPHAAVFVPRTVSQPPSSPPPAFWQAASTGSAAIEIRQPKKRKNRPHPNRSTRGAAARARRLDQDMKEKAVGLV